MIERRVSLYRHFGENSKLLYVGISSNAIIRTYGHQSNAKWYYEIVEIKIQHYPDLYSALIAEKKAIKTENPVYNKTHNVVKIKSLKITESEILKYPLVVAERELISEFKKKLWSVQWIADHFGTSIEVIRYVLKNPHQREFPHGVPSDLS